MVSGLLSKGCHWQAFLWSSQPLSSASQQPCPVFLGLPPWHISKKTTCLPGPFFCCPCHYLPWCSGEEGHKRTCTACELIALLLACLISIGAVCSLEDAIWVWPYYHIHPFFLVSAGSSFVVSEGSYLDISDWLNPAKLSLYYQINATSPWVRDLCGQRTTDACEQLCDQDTGK